jgi:hypothetical protein
MVTKIFSQQGNSAERHEPERFAKSLPVDPPQAVGWLRLIGNKEKPLGIWRPSISTRSLPLSYLSLMASHPQDEIDFKHRIAWFSLAHQIVLTKACLFP